MSKQPEQIPEEQLITQLQELGYERVSIPNEAALLANQKSQLEKHNRVVFSEKEFEKVLNILSKGSVFEKARTLREKQHIIRDNANNRHQSFKQTFFWTDKENKRITNILNGFTS